MAQPSEEVSPQERARREAQRAEGSTLQPPAEEAGVPAWVWGLVGVIVLVALASGMTFGFLQGINFRPAAEDYERLLGARLVDASGGSVRLRALASDGPAAQAGIQAEDELISIDARSYTRAVDAQRAISGYRAGQTVQIVVRRAPGLISQHSVTLGGYGIVGVPPATPLPTVPPISVIPQQPQGTQEAGALGVYYKTLEPDNPFNTEGALIVTVWPGGSGDLYGLQAGDIILHVERFTLSQGATLADALASYSAGQTVNLRLLRDGEQISVRVPLGSY